MHGEIIDSLHDLHAKLRNCITQPFICADVYFDSYCLLYPGNTILYACTKQFEICRLSAYSALKAALFT